MWYMLLVEADTIDKWSLGAYSTYELNWFNHSFTHALYRVFTPKICYVGVDNSVYSVEYNSNILICLWKDGNNC